MLRHPAVDQALLQRACEQAAQVFSLGDQRKRALTNGAAGAQPRGHVVYGAQRALAGHPGEFKEAWHLGPGSASGADIAANIWPDELSAFRQAAEATYRGLNAAGHWILRGCERYLELPAGQLTSMVEGGPGLLRMLSYPHLSGGHDRIGLCRTASHSDSCLITVMGNPSRPGLEIQSAAGEWLAVPQRSGMVIANCGDILEIVSGGRLRSANHRVVTKGAENSERLAMPMFMIPRHDAPLELPAENGSTTNTTVGEYLTKRLAELPRY